MAAYNTAVDDFIAKKPEALQPVLEYFRELVHETCVEAEETIKWGMPFFMYKKDMLCHMAAFKHHAAIGFWKASLMTNKMLQFNAETETSMGHLGKISSVKDMPSKKILIACIKEAMKLNDDGIKLVKKPPAAKADILIPTYFTQAILKNKKAKAVFESFSHSCKKEYIEWITEAKTETTRNKRLASALQMMEDGKKRHWKYI